MIVRARPGPPAPPSRGGRPCKYPWDTMAVDETFVIEGEKTAQDIAPLRWRSEKRTGRKFSARRCGPGTNYPDAPRGVMVWRVL